MLLHQLQLPLWSSSCLQNLFFGPLRIIKQMNLGSM